ncbi:hypothetical protein [Pseudoxanthobacter sp.]|uniref:hypothetical protein n=1 Tax=Pseudoxanthobacter sp. TaxID=1925742 RepID=UPI002FE40B47
MSVTLADRLPDRSGKAGLRLWLKSSGYARRLLMGEAGDPWVSAPAYLAFFTQAHGLLRPDVAVIEVADLYRSWIARHPELVTEMAAKRRAAWPLRAMLEAEGPRRLLAEVVEAVAASLRGQAPVVLALPAPRQWLAEASAAVGRPAPDDGDAVEDAAMYLADLARAVSSLPVGGLLIEAGDGDLGDVEAWRPLANVARHYRWGLVLRHSGSGGRLNGEAADFDAVIAAVPPAAAGAGGRDIGPALWGDAPLSPLAAGEFYFAEVPPGSAPEAVLENLARLRA